MRRFHPNIVQRGELLTPLTPFGLNITGILRIKTYVRRPFRQGRHQGRPFPDRQDPYQDRQDRQDRGDFLCLRRCRSAR